MQIRKVISDITFATTSVLRNIIWKTARNTQKVTIKLIIIDAKYTKLQKILTTTEPKLRDIMLDISMFDLLIRREDITKG